MTNTKYRNRKNVLIAVLMLAIGIAIFLTLFSLEPSASAHANHPICGDADCAHDTATHTAGTLTYTPLDQSMLDATLTGSGTEQKYVIPAGSYYLAEDLSAVCKVEISGKVELCLAGRTFALDVSAENANLKGQVSLTEGSALAISDCSADGTGEFHNSTGGVTFQVGAVTTDANTPTAACLYIFGGTFRTNVSSTIAIRSYTADVYIHGGEILCEGTAIIPNKNSNVYITGGLIKTTGSSAYAINMQGHGSVTMSGGAIETISDGIHLNANNMKFTMTGGSITAKTPVFGWGSGSSITISGGTLLSSANANSAVVGVIVTRSGCKVTISGTPVLTGKIIFDPFSSVAPIDLTAYTGEALTFSLYEGTGGYAPKERPVAKVSSASQLSIDGDGEWGLLETAGVLSLDHLIHYGVLCGTESGTCANCSETYTPPAEHAYGTMVAKRNETCSEDGYEAHYYCTGCRGYFTTEKVVTTFDALVIPLDENAHSYSTGSYKWSDDLTTCTASRSCRNNSAHRETETVNVSSAVTQAASCELPEQTTYTAEFTNTAFAKQTKTETTGESLGGHVYGTPSYTWSEDNASVTASRVCTHDATHVESETVETASAVAQAQGCGAEELTDYTATFANTAFATQSKEDVKTKDALTHAWGTPSYTWSEDNASVTASRVCAHDAAHVESETVETASAVAQAQGCGVEELTDYTATFANTAFATQSKEDVKTKDALSHAWGEWRTVTSATCIEGGSERRLCTHDSSHSETRATEPFGHNLDEYTYDGDGHTLQCITCAHAEKKAAHTLDDAGLCVCGYEKTGLPGGAIAGIVVGSVLVLGGGGFALWWFVFRRRFV